MHSIEPFFSWRDQYAAEEDKLSPFFQRQYSEFEFINTIYNYYIHPQWDGFGSPTLYMKILYSDYENQFAIIELIGEWNDAINNDIMFLKRDVIDVLIENKINKFVLIAENVLNFHTSDDCYYEEWYDDIKDDGGWITIINLRDHIECEMKNARLNYYLNFGNNYNFNWRTLKPAFIPDIIEELMIKSLR